MFPTPGASRPSIDSFAPNSPGHRTSDYPLHRPPGFTHQRRTSTASSIHSVGGSLDTSSAAHTLPEIGQNAISVLLQPPIVRTGLLPHAAPLASSGHKPPTSRDIPPVTLTNIQHVDSAEFKQYISQVTPLYEQLRRIKESEDEESRPRQGSRADEGHDAIAGSQPRSAIRPTNSRKSSIASLASLSTVDPPTPTRRSSSGFGSRKANQGPPPLSTIPNVYFEDDFHLENPRTFDVVSERAEVVRSATSDKPDKAANGSALAPRKALATNAILQEKLSWYMDTVEMHLINSISTASTTFFSALGSLRELHSEAADSVDRIGALRTELQTLDQEIAVRGLDILQKRRRLENLRQLEETTQQLRIIVRNVQLCSDLVDDGQPREALDELDRLEKLIAGEGDPFQPGPPLRDLRGLKALQGISADISSLRWKIGKMYERKFTTLLSTDMRKHVDGLSSQEVLMRWTSASSRARGGHSREPSAFPGYLTGTDEMRAPLADALIGLHRARHVNVAAVAYKDVVLREVRNAVRRPLPTSNDDDNESMASMVSSSTLGAGGRNRSQQEKSTILARNLRALDPEDAEQLLMDIYIGVAETLRRITTQMKVMLDITSSMGQPPGASGMRSPPPKSPSTNRPSADVEAEKRGLEIQEQLYKTVDLGNLLGQAVDVAQEKIVKVLRVRAEQSKQLSLGRFLRYFALNVCFANECEAVSGRGGAALKTVVNAQIREFVTAHGEAEKQRLAQGMGSDQWDPKDFGEQEQALLDRILRASTADAPEWLESGKIYIPYTEDEDSPQSMDSSAENPPKNASANTNGTSKAAAAAKIRPAVIDEESFVLATSAHLCIAGMAQFLRLATGIPSMAAEVAASLIAYLQLFNSRCTQLILGAGATRSAGLKNINTKHLALASRALAFVAAVIPHAREFMRRHAGGGSSAASSGGGAGGSAGQLGQLMGDFDKVRRAILEHQSSIYDKLVEMMGLRATSHARALRAIAWDDVVAGGVGTSPSIETLTKETLMLHKALTKYMPEPTVGVIMIPVFAKYKDQLGDAVEGVTIASDVGIARLRLNIDYFNGRLNKIDGFGDTADYLYGVVRRKEDALRATEAEEKAKREAAEKARAEQEKREASEKARKEKEKQEEEEAKAKKKEEEARRKKAEAAEADGDEEGKKAGQSNGVKTSGESRALEEPEKTGTKAGTDTGSTTTK